jgi:hypothetical protein
MTGLLTRLLLLSIFFQIPEFAQESPVVAITDGRVRGDTVLENGPEAESQLRVLSRLGVDLNAITDKLQVDGVASFASAYARVWDTIGKKLRDLPQHSLQV